MPAEPHHPLAAPKPPLVGRAVEVQRLTAALTRAANGQGSALFLTGPAGIGKTRLALETLAMARARGFLVLHGRAYAVEGGLAYAPILDALGPFLRRLDPTRQASLVGGLADLGRLFGGLRLPPAEPLDDPSLEKTRLFEAVARLCERLAREAPLVLLLDDLHWADPVSLELFHYVARGLADQRALLLATCSSPQLDVARGLRPMLNSLQRVGLAEELIVAPLASPAVAALACNLLNGEPPASLLDLLAARAGGTPLYVEGLIRAFLAGGQLAAGSSGWNLDPAAASLLPAGLRQLALERLERLEGSERQVLDLIAVSGGAAFHAVLCAASGLADEALLATLDRLRANGLVAEEVVGPEVVYRLAHPLLQEVAYAELPAIARRRAHAGLARALERLRPADLERLAQHYRGAGPEADGSRALAVLLAAGERAREVYAHDEAAQHFGAALALVRAGHHPHPETGHGGPLAPLLLLRLGEAWERVGEVGAAVAVWAEALAEYERLGDAPALARLYRLLALAEWDRGHFAVAQAHLEAGLAALAGRDPTEELADLHLARILVLSRRGDTAVALAGAAALRDLAGRLGSPRALAEAHLAEASAHFEKWDLAAAREHAARGLAAAEKAADPLLCQRAIYQLALITLVLGDHPAGRELGNRGLALAQRLRAPTAELLPRFVFVAADLLAGAWDEALRRCDEGLALARRVGHPRLIALFLSRRALLLAYRGELVEAEACVAAARAAFGGGSRADRHVLVFLPLVETVLALERGQTALAHALARAFGQPSAADPTGGLSPGGVPIGLALLAETQVAAGEPQSALATARCLSALKPPPVRSRVAGREADEISITAAVAARAEGLARQALGEHAVALSCLAQAAAAFAGLEMPFELARARLEWAASAAVADPDRRQAAATAAAESLAIFERLGARRYAQRARQLCQQLGVHPPAARRSRPSGGPLSSRELEVARLAVEGLTAPEIADRLAISQHTATTHLRRIYARLGINSRAALARYVVEAGLLDAQS